MRRRIVGRSFLSLGLTAALLAVTASTAGAVVTLAPNTVDFGNRQVGTTSPAQAHTLTLRCSTFLGINFCQLTGIPITFAPAPSVSGEFSQTNNCPPLLSTTSSTGVSCTINSTFTPTSTGPKTGTLSTGTGGPTASLTGVGVTTPTPPTPPTAGTAAPPPLSLLLSAKEQPLGKALKFSATTNHDAELVATGPVKRTAAKLVAGQKTTIKATLKTKARKSIADKLASHKAKTTVQVSASDQAGATAIGKVTVKFKRKPPQS